MVVNLYDSLVRNVVSKDTLADFIRECLSYSSSHGYSSTRVFSDCCYSAGDGGKPRFLRLAKVRPTRMHGTVFRHTVGWSTFWGHHQDKVLVARHMASGIPAIASGLTRSQATAARTYLERAITIPNWSKLGAYFGAPCPVSPNDAANCWISSDVFDLAGATTSVDRATLERDSLGLIDSEEGDALVRYTFDADAAYLSVGGDTASPTFLDGGNARFRVRDTSARARKYRLEDWGATVNLAAFALSNKRRITGLPERVSKVLAIDKQNALRAELLGFVGCNRGATLEDDHSAYASYILAKRNISHIVQRILRRLPKR